MTECPSCKLENTDSSARCPRCGTELYGRDPLCGVPTFAGTSAGQVLDGRYVIVRKLASDALGVLYEAEDAESDSLVLLWALVKITADAQKLADDLRQKAQAVLELDHPNILRVLAFRFGTGVNYVVTEHFSGQTLEKQLSQRGPLSIEEAAVLFAPIAEALDYAHGSKVCHADICPANVILPSGSPAKLANFQLSWAIKDALAKTGSDLPDDAVLYMAPEHFTPRGPGPRSDIYSLAATLYRCLCHGTDRWRGWMEYQVLKESPKPLENLGDEQNAALLKALARDSRSRYRSARRLLADLCPPGARGAVLQAMPAREPEEAIGAAAEPHEPPAAETLSRLQGEQRARAEAEQKLAEYVRMLDQMQAELREKQAEYARKIEAVQEDLAEMQQKLDRQSQALAEAQAQAQAESQERARLEAKLKSKAEAAAAKQARREAREKAKARKRDYERRIAEATEAAKSEARARAQAEKKLQASETARTRLEERIKSQEQERLDVEARLEAIIQEKARLEEQLSAQSRTLTTLQEQLKAEKQAKLEAEQQLAAQAEATARAERQLEAQLAAAAGREQALQAQAEQAAQAADQLEECSKRATEAAEQLAERDELIKDLEDRLRLESDARRRLEDRLVGETEARKEAEEQLEAYARELAELQARLPEVLPAELEPDEQTEMLAPTDHVVEELLPRPRSRRRSLVAAVAFAAFAAVGAVMGYRYIEARKAPPQAIEAWSQAQVAAAEEDFVRAIKLAKTVRTDFPEYAEKKGIAELEAAWQNDLAAHDLWLRAQESADRLDYDQALAHAEKILQLYPRSRYAVGAGNQAPVWRQIVSVHRKTEQLLSEARAARDANDFDTALAAVDSALALDPDNAAAGILRAEIKTAQQARQRLERIAAGNRRRLQELAAQALLARKNRAWETAIQLYVQALALAPDDPGIIDDLALCRHNLYLSRARSAEANGDLEAAIDSYTKAVFYTNSPVVREELRSTVARLQERLRIEQAREQLAAYIKKAREAELAGDVSAAVEWYGKAAEGGDPNAMYKLAMAYLNGNGVAQDLTEAFGHFRKAAEAGNAEAMYTLAQAYHAGQGLEKDLSQAVHWYNKAAEAGNAEAMHSLAAMYFTGEGLAKDNSRAVEWLVKAAKAGSTQAMYNLAVAYYNGDGIARDFTKAVEWFRKAAEAGDVAAMYNLALAHLDINDYTNARKWFISAANEGNVEAMYNLGVIYHNGYGLARDYRKALEWYRKAAEGGDSNAMVNLGLLHHDGLGTPRDPAKAVEWYSKGAEAGNGRAMANLAMAYYNGDGIEKDPQRAIQLLEKAAGMGEAMAMFNLAVMYQNGWSVKKDYEKAAQWYRKAAEAGDDQAMYNLGMLYRKGNGVPKDTDIAVEWYRKAAQKGNAQAKAELVKLGESW